MLDSGQCLPVVVDTSNSQYSRLRRLPLSDVRLSDGFLESRRCLNREATLPSPGPMRISLRSRLL